MASNWCWNASTMWMTMNRAWCWNGSWITSRSTSGYHRVSHWACPSSGIASIRRTSPPTSHSTCIAHSSSPDPIGIWRGITVAPFRHLTPATAGLRFCKLLVRITRRDEYNCINWIILTFDVTVPESDFQLQYRTDYDGIVNIMCNAFDISPEPELVLA